MSNAGRSKYVRWKVRKSMTGNSRNTLFGSRKKYDSTKPGGLGPRCFRSYRYIASLNTNIDPRIGQIALGQGVGSHVARIATSPAAASRMRTIRHRNGMGKWHNAMSA